MGPATEIVLGVCLRIIEARGSATGQVTFICRVKSLPRSRLESFITPLPLSRSNSFIGVGLAAEVMNSAQIFIEEYSFIAGVKITCVAFSVGLVQSPS